MVVTFFSWWYGRGWRQEASAIAASVGKLTDVFSIPLLLTTLFSPFRQISAGRVQGSLDVMFRAWLDRLISRLIGAMVRSTMILVGSLMITLTLLLGGTRLVVWPLLPFIPLLAVLLTITGWVPWQS